MSKKRQSQNIKIIRLWIFVTNKFVNTGSGKNLHKSNRYEDSIYRFSLEDSNWEELCVEMPTELANFGLVATENEQYIIILRKIHHWIVMKSEFMKSENS